MSNSKAKSKKQHGVDFKKIRRKIGKKLPPPKNATNTEIKSKAIVLPEQSVAAEKAGLAVNRRGLTLKELLQQTSHRNAKVRKDALIGIKDLFIKHPAELKLHKCAAVEKLRQRIGDEDRNVRKSLYDLFKLMIIPGCKEDNRALITSLLMGYIFHAMTHLAVDIRVMAFDFLDLVLEFYPQSFTSYAEKILQNYENILSNNQYHLQDKGKLKDVFAGLVHCLSLLPWNEGGKDLQNKQNDSRPPTAVLQPYEDDMPLGSKDFSHIIKKLEKLVPVLIHNFQEFLPSVHAIASLEGKSFGCVLSILHSIDLIIRSFVYETNKERFKFWGFRECDVTISSLLLKKLFPLFPLNQVDHLSEKDNDRLLDLNVVIAKIFFELNEWTRLSPDSLEKFLEFFEGALVGKICKSAQSGMAIWEKHLAQLLPFIPKFVSRGTSNWTSRLLQAFTQIFRESNPGSKFMLACLSTIDDMLSVIEDMIIPVPPKPSLKTSNSLEIQDALMAWITELPLLLIKLGDKHPACSEVVLRVLLRIGQRALYNSSLVCMYDNIQNVLQEFYSTCQEGGEICYGPFLRLPREPQHLSICCLHYVSHLNFPIIMSVGRCCLSPELDPWVSSFIIDILDDAYRIRKIRVKDHLSFLVTLAARYKVTHVVGSAGSKSCRIFMNMTRRICRYMEQMRDNSSVLRLIESLLIDEITKLPLENACSVIMIIGTLDSKPSQLSEQSIITLGHYLPEYLIDAAQYIPHGNAEQHTPSCHYCHYYIVPCFFLFDRCGNLLSLVLKSMASIITVECTQDTKNWLMRVNAIAYVLLWMYKDAKMQAIMSTCKEDINNIIQNVLSVQSKEGMRIEEKHTLKCTYNELQVLR